AKLRRAVVDHLLGQLEQRFLGHRRRTGGEQTELHEHLSGKESCAEPANSRTRLRAWAITKPRGEALRTPRVCGLAAAIIVKIPGGVVCASSAAGTPAASALSVSPPLE